ncbi:MAG: 30S ribosomal protein S8 [Deltaproteobacteria bacterium]|nr:30S ribosomal protein S8 [Deltaproteobacteria bacterium]MCL4874761.1 30S ribosomal protein S8 [bacterium]
MSMTDPIADMLTRLRNAVQAKHQEVVIPSSGVKLEIAKILKEEGFIKDVSSFKEGARNFLKIQLKWNAAKKSSISSIRRTSKPGLRKYVGKDEIPRVLNGLGVAIVSTSRGVMTDRKARELGVGGEILCTIH